MKIAISAESTIDLLDEHLIKYDIKTVALGVFLGDELLTDNNDLTLEKLFAFTKNTGILPKTNAVNAFQYEEFFNNLKEEYDAVIHISLSSHISSCCSNAQLVASKMENVFVIDSESLSTGIALLAIYARQLTKQQLTAQQIVKLVEERKKAVSTTFVLDKLDYLHKGGRCSGVAKFFATTLNIKPTILMKEGKLIPDQKYKGKFEIICEKYLANILQKAPLADKSVAILTYTIVKNELVEKMKKQLLSYGFENVICSQARATISSHCGANTLGIMFFTDGDKNTTL